MLNTFSASEVKSTQPEKAPLENVESAHKALQDMAGETEKIDQATFEPEAAVEGQGDYKRAEQIEQAFVAAVETKDEQVSTDTIEPDAAARSEPGQLTNIHAPEVEANLPPVYAESVADEMGRPGEIVNPENLEGGIEGKEDVPGRIDLEALTSENELDALGSLPENNTYAGLDSLTGILDNKPGSEDTGPGHRTPHPSKDDLNVGNWPGPDSRISAGESSTSGTSGTSTTGTSTTTDEVTITTSTTDTTSSNGDQTIVANEVYDSDTSRMTIETVHENGETTQKVIEVNKVTGKVVIDVSRMTPKPDSGPVEESKGGNINIPFDLEPGPGDQPQPQPIDPDAEGGTESENRNRPLPMSFDEAMAAHIGSMATYPEEHSDTPLPEVPIGEVETGQPKPVDPPGGVPGSDQ